MRGGGAGEEEEEAYEGWRWRKRFFIHTLTQHIQSFFNLTQKNQSWTI